MHPNAQLLHDFYDAFSRRDHVAMGSVYGAGARFHDPVFPDLNAEQVRAMWHMLVERGTDLELAYGGVEADEATGGARWEATYTFRKTGRRVHNVIDAAFRFQDGRIVEHTDSFDLWRWARMALGPVGMCLGWTPFVRRKVRRLAAGELARWIEKQSGQPGTSSTSVPRGD